MISSSYSTVLAKAVKLVSSILPFVAGLSLCHYYHRCRYNSEWCSYLSWFLRTGGCCGPVRSLRIGNPGKVVLVFWGRSPDRTTCYVFPDTIGTATTLLVDILEKRCVRCTLRWYRLSALTGVFHRHFVFQLEPAQRIAVHVHSRLAAQQK